MSIDFYIRFISVYLSNPSFLSVPVESNLHDVDAAKKTPHANRTTFILTVCYICCSLSQCVTVSQNSCT